MSAFGKLFGFKEEESKITTDEAIQKLRETEEMLLKKQKFLQIKIENEIGIARKYGVANKRVAIQALKRKKRYEKQLQQIECILSTIEIQREALEGANTNTAVFNMMSQAAKALRSARQHVGFDTVQDTMDETAEHQCIAYEISDAISDAIDLDDEEFERELEDLEKEGLDEALLNVAKTKLPEVPGTVPVAAERRKDQRRVIEEDDDDMKKLADWAS